MPTYERCDKSIEELAQQLLKQFESHKPLIAAEVKIDFVFAHADLNDKGIAINDAITKNGIKALGLTRKIALKDRVLGRGDAEIVLDGDWWKDARAEEQAALLDHELHHISVKADKSGNIQFDDIGRPQIRLRKHDAEFGWFKCIAERHGSFSIERQQAKFLMDHAGQFFWPDIAPTVQITTGNTSVVLPVGTFAKAATRRVQ